MLEASQKLLKAYPEYGSITTKRSGMTEFRLFKIQNHKGEETNKNTKKKKNKNNNTRKNI
jgi:hypothetical protein